MDVMDPLRDGGTVQPAAVPALPCVTGLGVVQVWRGVMSALDHLAAVTEYSCLLLLLLLWASLCLHPYFLILDLQRVD